MVNPGFLANKLSRPYYLELVVAKRWLNCLNYGAFVFFFLVLFQPFGLSSLPAGIISTALGFGLTTFFVMALLNVPFFLMAVPVFSEEKWTVRKELYWNLINVSAIGLANAVFSACIGMSVLNLRVILIFEFYTLVLALIPITITVLVKESRLKNKFEKRSEEINSVIDDHKKEAVRHKISPALVIYSENRKEKVEIYLNELVFIQASENYVEVYYLNRDSLQKKLLRNTLKAISSDLESHQELFRCHKSYLVNISRVEHVSGNAQGYKLHLKGTGVLIPVSRQNNEEIKKRFKR